MPEQPGSPRQETAELIQAKAAQHSNYIQLIGVLVTAIGTIGGLIITVMLTGNGTKDETAPATPQSVVAAPSERTTVPALTPTAGPAALKTVDASTAPVAVAAPADLALDLGDGTRLALVMVKPGEFLIGSPASESGRSSSEGPQHKVRITKPYYIGAYEVTQEQYEKVMGANPSSETAAACPVENVTWEQAAEFCRRVSRRAGKTVRLPTEAEWEYAARAGTTTPFATGPSLGSDEANVDGTEPYGGAPEGANRARPVAVGSFPPNPWGLYDVHGNVKEWCADWYAAQYAAGKTEQDPTGPAQGSSHVVRGGSWKDGAAACRSAARRSAAQGSGDTGFRVVVAAQ